MTDIEVNNLLIQIARGSFWGFCRVRAPNFYTKDKTYLKILCNTLQSLYENTLGKENLIINMPPRHGKTRTMILFSQWILGKDTTNTIMASCYNETLSSRMAKGVRDGIGELKADQKIIVYNDIFPKTKIKDGDASMNLWSLSDQHFSYLATSPNGTMTGFGARFLVVDDLIKNAYEAFNARILDEHQEWYQNTVLSRCEQGCKKIIIATRWATGDLTGKLLEQEPDDWYVLSMPAFDGEKMLCDEILDYKEYKKRETNTDPVIFQGNYQQKPFDSGDKLYRAFQTYDIAPKGRVESYTDTADKGLDFLASCVYVVKDRKAYILDIIYNQDPMEKNESKVSYMLINHGCQTAHIESNNGGEGFARAVSKIMGDNAVSPCSVKTFHQSKSKEARIFSNANAVMNSIFSPIGWEEKFSSFYRDVSRMGTAGQWAHDDAADMLTGIIEKSLLKPELCFA